MATQRGTGAAPSELAPSLGLVGWLRQLCRSSAQKAAEDPEGDAPLFPGPSRGRPDVGCAAGPATESLMPQGTPALFGALAAADAGPAVAAAEPPAADADPDGAEDSCSAVSALREAAPFFARGGDRLTVIDVQVDDDVTLDEEPRFSLSCAAKAAAWSTDGQALAVVDPAQGLSVIEFSGGDVLAQDLISPALGTVQQLDWSPSSTFVVAQFPFKGGADVEPNVLAWRRRPGEAGGGPTYALEASFQNPKFERGHTVLQWTGDERICCHLLPDGGVELRAGQDLTRAALATLPLARAAQAFQFSPLVAERCACLAVFLPDTRDSLQRAVSPAMVEIFDVDAGELASGTSDVVAAAQVKVQFGQQAELKWCPSGTALLAHCQTDVDDSGQSYYGGSKLVLMSKNGEYTLDLTVEKPGKSSTAVQAVAWSPTRDEFILVQGFQPAEASLWVWDSSTQACTLVSVLLEKAHRNTIRWNQFGSLVCIAGFGNLAGEVDFLGRTGGDGSPSLARLASCEASCTVSAEWAPDGRHLMTAVLAPRMRVDNGLRVWWALSGAKVAEMPWDELLEVQWRPEPTETSRFFDLSVAEIEHARHGASTRLQKSGGEKKKQAYRPPSARDAGSAGNSVARMMRGEVESSPSPAVAAIKEQMSKSSSVKASPTPPEGDPGFRRGPGANASLSDLGSASPAVARRSLKEAAPPARRPNNEHGTKAPCPTTGWEYMDPKGNKQGPFTLEQMQSWFNMGKLKSSLPLRCNPEDRFVPLGELWPHPMVPFLRAPLRPT